MAIVTVQAMFAVIIAMAIVAGIIMAMVIIIAMDMLLYLLSRMFMQRVIDVCQRVRGPRQDLCATPVPGG